MITERGSVVLTTMVSLALLVTLLLGVIQLVSTQAHLATDAVQTDAALALADAGIQYGGWLLQSGTILPNDLKPITNRPVVDDLTGNTVGSFDLYFVANPGSPEDLATTTTLTAVGHAGSSVSCQTITARLSAYIPPNAPVSVKPTYALWSWENLKTTSCQP